MKYFTKDWYAKCQRAHLDGALKESKRAESFSEDYYQLLLQNELRSFLSESQEWTDVLEEHDEKKWTEQFMVFHEKMITDLKSMLPADLLDKVADLRVLACTVAEKSVKKAVTKWCRELRTQLETIGDEYWRLAEAQKAAVGEGIQETFAFHDAIISAFKQEGNRLILKLEQNCYSSVTEVTFENPSILELEGDMLGAWWLYQEIYPVKGGNAYHVLLQRKDGQLAYLTLTATGISFVKDEVQVDEADIMFNHSDGPCG